MNAFDQMMGVNGSVGDVEIVGERVRQVAEVDKPGVYLNDGRYVAQDRIDIGFSPDLHSLAPAAQYEFVAECTTPFKPEELVIDSTQATDLSIVSINANSVQYIDGAPVPASTYSEVSNARRVSWGTIQTSGKIKITVRNDSGAAVTVRMSVRGLRLRAQ